MAVEDGVRGLVGDQALPACCVDHPLQEVRERSDGREIEEKALGTHDGDAVDLANVLGRKTSALVDDKA